MTITRPALNLRGKRFKPLDWDAMSPAQVGMVESVLTGKRGSMLGPYNVLLRSPELGDLAQKFGAHTRFNSSLPLALNELAIALGRVPQHLANLPSDVAAVYSFCHELQSTRKVSDATYAELVKHYGEAGVVDVMGTMSYYTLVSMSLNVDQYPLPEGEVAELLPL